MYMGKFSRPKGSVPAFWVLLKLLVIQDLVKINLPKSTIRQCPLHDIILPCSCILYDIYIYQCFFTKSLFFIGCILLCYTVYIIYTNSSVIQHPPSIFFSIISLEKQGLYKNMKEAIGNHGTSAGFMSWLESGEVDTPWQRGIPWMSRTGFVRINGDRINRY